MKIFLILISLLISTGISYAQDITFCDQIQPFTSSTPTTVTLVPGLVGKRIGYCGLILFTATNPGTMQIFRGTGTNCTTNQNPITANITLPPNQTFVNHLASAFLTTAPGEAVCLVTTGNGSISGSVFYGYH